MIFNKRPVAARQHPALRFGIVFDGGRGDGGNVERGSWRPATGSNKTFSISRHGHRSKKNRKMVATECDSSVKFRCAGRVSVALVWTVIAGGWSLCIDQSHAIQPESRAEKEANLQGQIQGNLFNRWTFDQQKSGEAAAGFSMLGFGEGPDADWRIKADLEAPSASNILTVNSSCQAVTCYRLIVADGFQYEYPDVSVRMRFPGGGTTGMGGVVFGVQDAAHFYAAVVDLRTNMLEVIRVVDGEETRLGRSSIAPKSVPWHTLRIQRNTILSKDFIETFFDGQLTVTVEDQSLATGRVGLLVRGQAQLDFDSLHAIPLFSQRPLSAPPAY